MATGGVDLLRRRDFRYSEKEFEHGKVCSRVVDASSVRGYGGRRENDSVSGSRRNGCHGRITGEREKKVYSRPSEAWTNNGEASKVEDVVLVPPEKKRKFSPIIWDRENDRKISFKKRVLPSTPLSPGHQSVIKSVSQVSDSVSNCPASEVDNKVEVSKEVEAAAADELVEPFLLKNSCDFSSEELLPRHGGVQPQDQMKEEGITETRNIFTSRWASEGDSTQHVSDDEWTADRRSSTPESGEFQREDSAGDRSVVSCSDDEDGFHMGSGSDSRCSGSGSRSSKREPSEDFMDGHDSRDAITNQVYFGAEDHDELLQIEEPTVSTSHRVNMLQSCRSVFEYEKLNKINEGTYGVVYKAKDKKTGEIVALKKVKMDVNKDDGFPLSSLREINILSSFSHSSIVNVKEVVMDDDDGVYMAMEYMEYDLKGLMETMKEPFSISEVKSLMLQLLEGVKYLHDNWVLHRDLKTSNILINKDGELKICDFGLSRQYGSPLKPYTALVVTLWYRAPEILLGTKEYSTAIDMWSVGCIMAELVAKEPLFRGKTEVEQLDKIFRTLGTPNETIWPGLSKLPGSKANFVKNPYNLLRKKFPATSFIGSPVLTDSGFDLLSKLLAYDPEKRITVEAALNHRWFVESPLPRSDFKPPLRVLQGQNSRSAICELGVPVP
ncbi:cyclin-dependent kinase G-2-like isoform X2 [Humulus lupulus]|uniref:cyclin-dependent kinase G-2-like isoform X2 n=1 Tax=Humulus lupulus TaxID=3486 RepID=UPI002B405250|nr:cyclin-dependent kinase G-2-like isoform X2 [Humulus lupulus]